MQTIALLPAARESLCQAIDVARRDVDTSTTSGTLLVGHRAATLLPWDSQVHELCLMSRTVATLITGLPVPEEDGADAAYVLQTAVAALVGVGASLRRYGPR